MIKFHINKIFPNMRKFGDIDIYQIGRLLGDSQTQVPTHIQLDYYELTIVTHGQGLIYTNNVPTAVKSGDIYLSLPGDTHKIESFEEDPLEFDFFTFKTNDSEYTKNFADISYYLHDPTTRVFRDEKINFLISNAIMELNNENNYTEKILASIFNQIVIYLIRDTYSGKVYNKTIKNKSEMLCLRVMNYIDTHINSIKSLTEIATCFGYDYSYISSLFKKNTGRTLNRYLQNKKLESAKLLLMEEKLKINEIAYLLNYSSPYSFSKAFKDKYGISPKAYIYSEKNKTAN